MWPLGLLFIIILRSVEYNEENLEKALDLQKSMEADMGGTEIFKPLHNVLKNKPSGSYARQVSVFISYN
jgi:hypothetical protein